MQMLYNTVDKTYPFAVLFENQSEGSIENYASQVTFFEVSYDGANHVLKVIKQKIQLGADVYELQEIYGIELHEKETLILILTLT